MVKDVEVIERTKRWISEFVIKYAICPFAGEPFSIDRIRYQISGMSIPEVMETIAVEIKRLESDDHIETTLIVIPDGLLSFKDYLDVLDLGEQLIVDLKVEGIFQLASFHPEYQFEGEAYEARSNLTNRSPYPMIHILREDSVYQARQRYRGIEKIANKNIQVLSDLSTDAIEAILKI